MSVQATSWVWDHSQADGAGLLVMLAIADAANKEGAASMQSVPTIAKMTHTSPRHVARCIAALLDMGELEKTGTSARYSTTVYRLPKMGADPVYPTPDTMSGGQDDTPDIQVTPPLTSDPSTPDTQVTQPQEATPKNNPTSSSADAEGASKPDQQWDMWWDLYPRKVGKLQARKAFDKARKDGAKMTDLGGGLERAVEYWTAAETPADKIPYPATWLARGGWEDEHPPVASAAGAPNGEDPNSWMHRTPDNTQ
jgi:hypothetical protein